MTSSSVKLFQFLQESYQAIGFYPSQSWLTVFNRKNLFVFLSILQLFLSSLAFLLFDANSMFEFGASFYTSITTLFSMVILLIKLWKITNILTLIEKFEEFIEKRTHNPVSMAMYKEVNAKVERISQFIHLILVKVMSPTFMISPLILTLVNYFVFCLKNESFYLPFSVMLPFNWKTPFGYLIALLLEASAYHSAVLGCIPFVCFLIGLCSFSMSFARDIADDFRLLDAADDEKNQSERKIKEKLCNAVQLFADAKQLVNEFNHIYETITMGFFMWTLLAMAVSLVVVQRELTTQAHSNPIELLFQIFLMIWSFVFVSLYCELGQMITNEYYKVDQQLFNYNWYKFPIEIQRMLLIVTPNIQQPITIRGYGNIMCTRDTLKNTTKCGFSYFMMLRRVDA